MDPLELWESDPFAAEARGEWLYARGVADDKGQLWMQLKAIESLVAEGPLPVGFRVVCDGEEETGGDAIARFLAADDGPADACLVLDGWMKRRNTPEFVLATRGLVALDLDVRTGERDLHSGHYGGTALNAIHALAQALTALFPRDGRLPEPLREGVTAPSERGARGLGPAPAGVGGARARGRGPARPPGRGRLLHPRLRRAVARRHRDHRRQAGPPEHDARLARVSGRDDPRRAGPGPDTLAAAAERLLREALPPGATLDVRTESTPPAVLPRDTEFLRLARDAFAGVFGTTPLLVRAGGTLPIMPALARRGIPSVLAGLALPDSHTHSPNERMLLETFPLGVAAARETYRALGRWRWSSPGATSRSTRSSASPGRASGSSSERMRASACGRHARWSRTCSPAASRCTARTRASGCASASPSRTRRRASTGRSSPAT